MTPPDVDAPTAGQIMVARQVVMDRAREVWAYDLLYHASVPLGSTLSARQGEGTARLLADAITAIGFDTLTDGKRAFIPVDAAMLSSGVPPLPSPERIVFVVGADAAPTRELLAACAELRNQGYGLAVTIGPDPAWNRALMTCADVVRVDVGAQPIARGALRSLLTGTSRAIATIATRVETQAQFRQSVAEGFDYFQGFFFGEPTIREGRAIPAPQLSRLQLVQALQDPNLSIDGIEALIKPDTALCYRTLRTVNSAAVAHSGEIKSVREALLRVGCDPIRRWAALWAFTQTGRRGSSELLTLSAIRARFCELLAERARSHVEPSEAFLLGLCSLLDAILDRNMQDLVGELPLAASVRDALLGGTTPLRDLLDCASAYGSGEWARATTLATRHGVDGKMMPKLWVEALRWSRALHSANA